MKIFLIASAVPFRFHGEPGVTALHVVTRALLQDLQRRGHTIALQILFDESRSRLDLTPAEQKEIADLRESGVNILAPLFVYEHDVRQPIRLRSLRLMFNLEKCVQHYYPGFRLRSELQERIKAETPDCILPLWSTQGVAATHGVTPVPRVAYHGDIDYEPMRCRLILDRVLFSGKRDSLSNPMNLFRMWDRRVRVALFKRAHLTLMRSLDAIANITASNSTFYASRGHPHSVYVRNTWVDSGKHSFPDLSSDRPVKIIGHLGYLNRTGGTYGLRFLLREVMPHLCEAMRGRPYEVHIIGGGEACPALQLLLQQDTIIQCGFVPDLDAALQSTDVFCLFNNAGHFRAAFTRHLVALSNGLCLVAHAKSREAIPELEHMHNALLCQTGREAAQMIALASVDRNLNRRIRKEGRETYERCFTPEVVAGKLEAMLQDAVRERA